MAPAPDGVPEAATLADESSATTFSPGMAPDVQAGEPEVISADSPDTVSEGREPTPPSATVAATGVGLVNINSADEDTLVALPGIGRALARRIIAWRAERGPFGTVEDLIEIPGIGPRNINDFRAFITV
jgi:competence protein ComEA